MENYGRTSESTLRSETRDLAALVVEEIRESIAVEEELSRLLAGQIAEAGTAIVRCLQNHGKLIVFGNGGSAADAQHISAEFIGRYRAERKALAAIALTTDSSTLTAIGNDYGFDQVFVRQLEAIGKPGDVVLGISTSGNSLNVLRAMEYAKNNGLSTIALTGKSGGKLRGLADICLCVPSDSTPRIQEAHILIAHILSGIAEQAFLASGDTESFLKAKAGQG